MADVDRTEAILTVFRSVPRQTLVGTLATLVGGVLWFTGISVAIVSFNHHQPFPYSVWNHTFSELGLPFASPLTWVFNGTVTITSLIVPFILCAVSAHLKTRLGNIAAGFGATACVALCCMGIFGLKQDMSRSPYLLLPFMSTHNALAGMFFLGWAVSVLLFALAFKRHWKDVASRIMTVAGVVCALLCPTFFLSAIYPSAVGRSLLQDFEEPAFRTVLTSPSSAPLLTQWWDRHRPHFWWPTTLESILICSVLVWLAMAMVFLWSKADRSSVPTGSEL